jgi:hypothetical protein
MPTITISSNISSPNLASFTITIPSASDYSSYVQAITRAGGAWVDDPSDPTASRIFVPLAAISKITTP